MGVKMGLKQSQRREIAMLVLYEKQFQSPFDVDAAIDHIEDNLSELNYETSFEELTEEFTQIENQAQQLKQHVEVYGKHDPFNQVSLTEQDQIELAALVTDILDHQEEIDQMINKHIKGSWSVSRLENINLQILRIAVYEMLFVDNDVTPLVVSIDQGLELAKLYTDEKSRRFINGVLSSVMDELTAK
ncbi:hypothetical protein AWM75_02130 [Aerococcus urinaehominis]|uniref:Transcription antitermination protein NusB n=2 Tax=Aerococcus urinaehominis TaxID=128944 RepID=A0A109RGA8_9LACT|nr:hypothetical protein AWM75_02130 [Aerococcus urinaehominis]SDM16886.1 NusB antitermination factor [Aerococcus urinaehominis]